MKQKIIEAVRIIYDALIARHGGKEKTLLAFAMPPFLFLVAHAAYTLKTEWCLFFAAYAAAFGYRFFSVLAPTAKEHAELIGEYVKLMEKHNELVGVHNALVDMHRGLLKAVGIEIPEADGQPEQPN